MALYPHTGFSVQSVEDAVRLAEKVHCKNLGVTFNLCHWLMVDGKDLAASLKTAQPYLFCVTINGADAVGTSWKELIQPLDRGTYDVSQCCGCCVRSNTPARSDFNITESVEMPGKTSNIRWKVGRDVPGRNDLLRDFPGLPRE